ncbi:hypothetical protein MCOR02_012433 [Pyricularia oryzae]|nr:hypothetical protein MCOR02_012433 [Pyricularia oryzae]
MPTTNNNNSANSICSWRCRHRWLSFAGIPVIEDLYKKRQWAAGSWRHGGAFRVFARKGFTEGHSGHISVRDPVYPNTFWINPMGKHFGMLKASDMVHIDEAGQVIGGNRGRRQRRRLRHPQRHPPRPARRPRSLPHALARRQGWSAFARPLDIINRTRAIFTAPRPYTAISAAWSWAITRPK